MKYLLLLLLPIACLASDANLTLREGGGVRRDACVFAMDFETGGADDLSGAGNNGTIANAIHIPATPTESGNMLFDGTGDEIDGGNDTSLDFTTENFTISLWVKMTDNDPNHSSIERGDWQVAGWNVIMDRGRPMLFTNQSGARQFLYSNPLKVNDGNWHHVILIKDTSIATYGGTILVDNVAVSLGIVGGALQNPLSNSHQLITGGTDGVQFTDFPGTLDEVLIYNVRLTTDEITELYLSELARHPSPFVATPFRDESGNGNDLTTTIGSVEDALNADLGNAFAVNGQRVSPDPDASLDVGTGDFTFSFWMKTTYDADRQGIVTQGTPLDPIFLAWYIEINAASRLSAWVGDGIAGTVRATNDGAALDDGIWHLCTIVFDRDGNMTRYVDGAAYGTADDIQSISGELDLSDGTLTMTFINTDEDAIRFHGTIDDIRLYHRALSAGEVSDLFNWIGVSSTSLQAWYDFD